MHADGQFVGDLLGELSPTDQAQNLPLAARKLRLPVARRRKRKDRAVSEIEQLAAHALQSRLVGRHVHHAQRKPDIAPSVELQHLILLDDADVASASLHPIFVDQLHVGRQLPVLHKITQAGYAVAVQSQQIVGMDMPAEIGRVLRFDALHVIMEQLRKIVRSEDMTAPEHVVDRNPAVGHPGQQRQPPDMAFQHRVVQLPGIELLRIQQLFVFALQ